MKPAMVRVNTGLEFVNCPVYMWNGYIGIITNNKFHCASTNDFGCIAPRITTPVMEQVQADRKKSFARAISNLIRHGTCKHYKVFTLEDVGMERISYTALKEAMEDISYPFWEWQYAVRDENETYFYKEQVSDSSEVYWDEDGSCNF